MARHSNILNIIRKWTKIAWGKCLNFKCLNNPHTKNPKQFPQYRFYGQRPALRNVVCKKIFCKYFHYLFKIFTLTDYNRILVKRSMMTIVGRPYCAVPGLPSLHTDGSQADTEGVWSLLIRRETSTLSGGSVSVEQ
jgi:hypothetical protein